MHILYQLLQAGVTNTYLVEESTIGFHASGRSSGQIMLRGAKLFSQMEEPKGIEYLNFVSENNRRFLNGLRNINFDTDLRDTGGLRFAASEEEFAQLQTEAAFILKHRALECPSFNSEQVHALVPGMVCVGAIFVPTESTFNPYKVVNGMREMIERKGPRVLTNCQVTEVVRNQDDSFAVSIRHKGTIKAKKIVYCTNAYTSGLLPELAEIMTCFRGQMIATDFLSDIVLQTLPQASMSFNNGNEYWRTHGGRLLVGGMRHAVRGHQVGILDDGEISPAVYDRLRVFVNETLPIVKEIKFTHTWSGIMSATRDQLPLIGALPNRPNEFILAGFNGYGYSHALHGSMIVKDLIMRGESSHPGVSLFDPARFLEV
jgi:glycine/D-amino acid oxidase-like deaminating enzyme